ncbi:MAG: DUF2304 domain-containing protein [Solirubrobacteraceae bacterium]|jgi:hypothetical protein
MSAALALAAHTSQTTATLQRLAVIAIAVIAFALVFELVRRRALMERYALVWLLAAVVLLVLAIWRGLLTKLSGEVGIYTPTNALFAAGFVFVIVLLLHFSLVISRLSEQSKITAQRLALLDERVRSEETDESRSAGAVGKG